MQDNFKSRIEWETKTLSDFMKEYTESVGVGIIDWEALAEGIIGRGYRLCQQEQASIKYIRPYSKRDTRRVKPPKSLKKRQD